MIYLRLALARGRIRNGSDYLLLNAVTDNANEPQTMNIYWQNRVKWHGANGQLQQNKQRSFRFDAGHYCY